MRHVAATAEHAMQHWTYLGHAMWLVEAGPLRLLCDPLLGATHHADVFELVPRREIVTGRLRPDLVLVSHRHGDHFDVPSLHALARADADSVVITPDPLVAWAARALGFHDVREVAPGTLLAFDDVALVTTPSVAPDEWGVMVGTGGTTGWNLVDTVLRGPQDVVHVRDEALRALGCDTVGLACVRWQPMLEIAAQLGESTAFPYRGYERVLRDIAAIDARAILPAAAGGSHREPYGWLDRVVFPLSEARARDDLSIACPGATILPGAVGSRIAVGRGGVEAVTHDAVLVQLRSRDDPRRFDPFSVPPLRDPQLPGADASTMRATVSRWLHEQLADALAAAWPSWRSHRALQLVVEVVWPSGADAVTFTVDGSGATVRAGGCDEWDGKNQVAGSMLWQVIEGRRGWGDVLLAGALRARSRAYRAQPGGGVAALAVGETFLYYALPYELSHERATRWEVEQVLAAADVARDQ
ncbi:MAG: MBL fold metallo-hydrolase [Nannocystaceae bacterium]|nr:MBL fold metallo-hydrolase [Nannocystaceae bacterium]